MEVGADSGTGSTLFHVAAGTGGSIIRMTSGGNQVYQVDGLGAFGTPQQSYAIQMTFIETIGGKTIIFGGGKITAYNSIGTVGNGVPAEYAQVNLTTQGAAIGGGATASTTLYAVPAAGVGMYRVSWYLKVTRAATTSSILGALTLKWTDGTDNVAQTMTALGQTEAGVGGTTNAGNATTSVLSGSEIIWAQSSTNITYGVAYTSVGGTTMQYEVHIRVEAL
jgi:hypothetical protein